MSFNIDRLEYFIQSAYPTVFGDELSYYEVLNKVVVKLNEVIDQSNAYFSEDIDTHVTSILTAWKTDGTLDSIINGSIFTAKADKTYVDSQLALKSNVSDTNGKADKTYVDSQLALKTDKTYTDAQLVLKADKTYVDNKVSALHVKSAGVLPTNTDNYALLQAFINANKGKTIEFDVGIYKISQPILLPSNTTLKGALGRWNTTEGTIIQKTTHTTETKYNVDAVICMDYDSGYHLNGQIRDLSIYGVADTDRNVYGIYTQSGAFINLENVHVMYVQNAYYTNNTWQSNFRRFTARYCDYGIRFESPNSSLTGTSCHFDKCFMSYMKYKGYRLYGLNYSTFTACGCDYTDNTAYEFERSYGITMNSCGSEYSADFMGNWAGNVTLNSCYAFHPKGQVANVNSAMIRSRQGGKTVINACKFDAMEVPNTDSYNELCDNGSTIVYIATTRPTGGKNTITPSGGGKIVEIGLLGLVTTP